MVIDYEDGQYSHVTININTQNEGREFADNNPKKQTNQQNPSHIVFTYCHYDVLYAHIISMSLTTLVYDRLLHLRSTNAVEPSHHGYIYGTTRTLVRYSQRSA
jgi:hypothetical protein